VAPGEYSLTIKLKVDIGTPDGTILKNYVIMTYQAGPGYEEEDDDTEEVTVTAPVMTITKVADASTADPGDIITYTITYKNTGTGISAHVWINDTIPADTTFVSASPSYTSVSGDVYTWHETDVKPGTYTITLKVRVDTGVKDGTDLINKVTLEYTDANGHVYPTKTAYANVTVTAPIMTVSKYANVSTAAPGDVITYTITYKNTGTGTAGHVWINDTIPADTTFVSASPGYTSVSGDTYTWHITNVATGAYTITIKVRVDTGTPDKTSLLNKVTLDYTDANGHVYPQESDTATVLVTAPKMTIVKTADVSTADPGDIITYTLTVKNVGTGVAAHVWINDTIPSDTTFVSASPTYTSVSGGTYTWHYTNVGAKTITITLKVRVNTGTPDNTNLKNCATLDYTDANGHGYPTQQSCASVTVTAPKMSIDKVADVTTADPGDVITYTITYKNTGTGTAAHVWINDTIPADTTFVSSSPAYTSVSGDTYTWHFTSVAPGTKTITLKVRVDTGTTDGKKLYNKVTMDYTDANGHVYPQLWDSASVTVTAPVMTVTKTADVSTADPGDLIKYTITYTNTGTGNAGHVWINDTIPADTTFVLASPAHISVLGDT
jgi:uncharacterized repeat protein (TIGR01451 family)